MLLGVVGEGWFVNIWSLGRQIINRPPTWTIAPFPSSLISSLLLDYLLGDEMREEKERKRRSWPRALMAHRLSCRGSHILAQRDREEPKYEIQDIKTQPQPNHSFPLSSPTFSCLGCFIIWLARQEKVKGEEERERETMDNGAYH